MIIGERNKKGIIERIAANEERIRSIRSEIDDLEREMSWREDDLDTDQKCLASMEGDSE